MILQNIIFPKIDKEHLSELYYRKEKENISFNTYFNSFSIEKWKKYTSLDELYIHFESSKQVEFTLFNQYIQDKKVITKKVDTEKVSINKYKILTEKIEKGIIFLKLKKNDFDNTRKISYMTKKRELDIRLGIVVCTYNRENYIKELIKVFNVILSDTGLSEKIKIYIVDNARNLEIEADGIEIIKNRNYGGTGGFTRGIMQGIEDKVTNILLMDDDIEVEDETIRKLLIFISLLKDEYKDYFISGGMLIKDVPNIQYELTGIWKKYKTKACRSGVDLCDIKKIIENENEIQSIFSYAAWWFCSFNVERVLNKGLPFPFFIRCDDIEFSLRNDSKLITLNGLSVWHEDFKKKYSNFLYYYTTRNSILTNMLIEKIKDNRIKFFINILLRYCYNIVRFRIIELKLMRRALEDILLESAFFMNTDPESYHKEIIQLINNRTSIFYELPKTILVIAKVLWKYKRIKMNFQENKEYLSSFEFWKKYLGYNNGRKNEKNIYV